MKIHTIENDTAVLVTQLQKIPGIKFVVEWMRNEIEIKIFSPSKEHRTALDPTTLTNSAQFYGAGVACNAFTPMKVQFNSPSCILALGTDKPPAGVESFIEDEVRKALEIWLATNLPRQSSAS